MNGLDRQTSRFAGQDGCNRSHSKYMCVLCVCHEVSPRLPVCPHCSFFYSCPLASSTFRRKQVGRRVGLECNHSPPRLPLPKYIFTVDTACVLRSRNINCLNNTAIPQQMREFTLCQVIEEVFDIQTPQSMSWHSDPPAVST